MRRFASPGARAAQHGALQLLGRSDALATGASGPPPPPPPPGAQAPSQWRSPPARPLRARARAARAASDPEACRSRPVAVPPPGPWGRASACACQCKANHAPSSHVCARDHRQATILLQVSPGLFLFGAGFKLHVAPNLKQQALDRRHLPSLNSVETVAICSYHDLGSLPIPLAAKTTSPLTHSLTHSEKREPTSGLHFDEATIGAQ